MKTSTHSVCVLIASVPHGDQRGVGKLCQVIRHTQQPLDPFYICWFWHLSYTFSVSGFSPSAFRRCPIYVTSFCLSLNLSAFSLMFFCPYQFRHSLSFPPSSHSASSCISLCLVISTSAAIMYNPSSHLELVSVFSERSQEQIITIGILSYLQQPHGEWCKVAGLILLLDMPEPTFDITYCKHIGFGKIWQLGIYPSMVSNKKRLHFKVLFRGLGPMHRIDQLFCFFTITIPLIQFMQHQLKWRSLCTGRPTVPPSAAPSLEYSTALHVSLIFSLKTSISEHISILCYSLSH